MQPGKYAFSIPKGGTFDKTLTYAISGAAVNLSGYTAEMQIRLSAAAAPVVSLTQGTGLTLGSDGTIHIVIPATTTSTITTGTYEYDLYIKSPSGTVDFILGGSFTFTIAISQ